MAPPRHLKLTLPRAPPSSYTASTSESSSSSASVLDCDVPVPSIEHVDAADRIDRTANWVVQSSGSRAGSPTPPPRLSGSPAFTETSAPVRESSASRSPSLSDDNGIPRPSPSASPIRAASNPDGEREIKREATGGSVWSASPQLPPARRSPVSGPAKPAPSQSPSVSGSGALYPASAGSKRSRVVEVARPSFLEVVLATPERPRFLDVVLATPVTAVAPSVWEPVVAPWIRPLTPLAPPIVPVSSTLLPLRHSQLLWLSSVWSTSSTLSRPSAQWLPSPFPLAPSSPIRVFFPTALKPASRPGSMRSSQRVVVARAQSDLRW
jgi:hypothetical protein